MRWWPWRRSRVNGEAARLREESGQALDQAKEQRREARRMRARIGDVDVDAFTAAIERALKPR